MAEGRRSRDRRGGWTVETTWAVEYLERNPDIIERARLKQLIADRVTPGRALRSWQADFDYRQRQRERTHPELPPLTPPNDDVKITSGGNRIAGNVVSHLMNKGTVVLVVENGVEWLMPTDPPKPDTPPANAEPVMQEDPGPPEDDVAVPELVAVLEQEPVLPDAVARDRPLRAPGGKDTGEGFWSTQRPHQASEVVPRDLVQVWKALAFLERELTRTKAVALAKRPVALAAPPGGSARGWKLTEVYDRRIDALEAENRALRDLIEGLVAEVLSPKCGWSWVHGQTAPMESPCGRPALYRAVTKFRANVGVVDVCWEHSEEATARGMTIQPLLFDIRDKLLPTGANLNAREGASPGETEVPL